MSNQLFDLSGKTALVTGGSRGLGKGIATALASSGARIILAGRSLEQLHRTQEEFSGQGFHVHVMELDVSDGSQLLLLEKNLSETYGKIDILVNAAGLNVRKSILEITQEDWDKVMNTNLKGTFFVSQAAARLMMKQKQGKIINICSLTSHIGLPNMGPYCASKGGVNQLTKAMAVEWASSIQVNAIAPGYFQTEMTMPLFNDEVRSKEILSRIPQGRTGKSDDLYGIAVFLASAASDYITGQTIYVDGGWVAS
ncbi:glucose 1-dehydrogenase [Fictibacillus enclensis]|uniref:glucose 1-dehydrogenase n=1 Tax=Fictibacillus enclensis TaxID=1017270 RepID=UPI0025A26CDF|nr:glucose 1-dehydrogenase [Fictibacillus enclensis]MDM5338549.1 glucose 1-dehydrogenase [Fictibacillus enclensis]